ncbi:MAG: dihydrofolate reductase, partial [Chitinophagaceae bacterium]|nr:dihydrofolate reductase [Chitinophagaceae bacterium]
NIVITNQKKWNANGVVVVNSLDDAIFVAKSHSYKEMFIAGGGLIYNLVMNKADKIYLTRVHTAIEGDTFFPEINEKQWQKVQDNFCNADEKHAFNYSFQLWERK